MPSPYIINPFGVKYALGNVSAFLVQITASDITNSTAVHSFNLVGASGCVIRWGDSVETSWTTDALYSHTYTKAGTYLVQIKGPHTRFYHQGGTPTKVIEAMKLYTGITSGQATWYGCTNPLFHLHPLYRFHSGITTLANHFIGCTGNGFKLVEGLSLPASCISIYRICYGDSGNGFTSLPSTFVFTPQCFENTGAFYGATKLTSDISNKFPTYTANSSVSFYQTFYNAKITGTAPANKLWGRTDITWTPGGAFTGATTLTNYTSIPAAWGGGGA